MLQTPLSQQPSPVLQMGIGGVQDGGRAVVRFVDVQVDEDLLPVVVGAHRALVRPVLQVRLDVHVPVSGNS